MGNRYRAVSHFLEKHVRENKSALERVGSSTSGAVGTEAAAATQWECVFTLMTLELGLVPLPLYARTR
jgi:3-oxoacyl-(acyl-carrier-protein) synthase